jgi:hypothetical protein
MMHSVILQHEIPIEDRAARRPAELLHRQLLPVQDVLARNRIPGASTMTNA